MTDIRTTLTSKLKESLKSKDAVATSTIRLILTAIKDRDIAARGSDNSDEISDEAILSLLSSMISQRRESASAYEKGNRIDLATREEEEIEIIKTFLPKQIEGAELENALDEIIKELNASSIKDMGRVMNELRTRYSGQIDVKAAGVIAKLKLS